MRSSKFATKKNRLIQIAAGDADSREAMAYGVCWDPFGNICVMNQPVLYLAFFIIPFVVIKHL